MKKSLLIGYGNPGRGDDALGPLFAEAIEQLELPDLDIDIDFQLNVEDAYALEGRDTVIFVDASISGDEAFVWREVTPSDDPIFSSHSVSPAGVLALAKKLFNMSPRAYVLAIRGYSFDEFGAPLTAQAKANFEQALSFLKKSFSDQSLQV